MTTRNINSTIFKILLALALALVLILAFGGKAKAEEVNVLQFNPINMQGDTCYLFDRKALGIGFGYNVASIKDFIELRAEVVVPVISDGSSASLFGPAIGVNVPKLIQAIGGQWVLPNITSSIGFAYLANLNGTGETNFEPAVYLTIIKVNF